MSSTQSSSSMSRHTSQVDPLDSFVDFSDYEQVAYKQSPSLSPASSKAAFARQSISSTGSLMPTPQTLTGPSHPYDMHKQQTGIPTGGIANTLAINQQAFNYGFSSGLDNVDDFLDFNTAPEQSYDAFNNLDMDFDSPSTSPAFFFADQTAAASSQEFVNPNAIGGQENVSVAPTNNNVGRVWPGMHQQAALAKAQQQQRHQQLLIQRQQQRQQSAAQPSKQQRKSHQPTDPMVEEKISQLLHSMRQGSVATSDGDDSAMALGGASQRMRKDEEDMDEDERLLASEEGKKLSSKERRQLRNKVSARAFRSRRKEYIGQLEGEIAGKVNENSQLRAENKALLEENKRLSDLTRMLLSSPSFSGFLDNLSANATEVPSMPQAAPAPKTEQQPAENRVVRKDVNPYAAQQQMQNQQINYTILPEQNMDFSMLDLNNDFMYQPQVFSVLSLPETTIDTSVLSGKTSNFVGESFASEDSKIELPTIERAVIKEVVTVSAPSPVDEEFNADPAFALFVDAPAPVAATAAPVSPQELAFSLLDSILVPDKASPHFELVVADVEDGVAAMARFNRLCSCLDAATARLEDLMTDL